LFCQTLIFNYLKIKHPRKINQNILIKSEFFSKKEMSNDSFIRYAKNKKFKGINPISKRGYIIKGTKLEKDEINLIIGTMPLKDIKKIIKNKRTTITVYLAALLIKAIYEENYKYYNSKKPIVICIPINLRKYFESTSMNNFFTTVQVSIDFYQKQYTFDELINEINNQLESVLDKDKLASRFKLFVDLQQNAILRFVPLVIKNIILKIFVNTVGNNNVSSLLTNMGNIEFSNNIRDFVDKFYIMPYPDKNLPFKVCVSSINNKLSVIFTSHFVDTDIQRYFLTNLSNQEIDITIEYSIPDNKSLKEI